MGSHATQLVIALRNVPPRRGRRRKRPPRVLVPKVVQASYYSEIVRLLEEAKRLVDRDVPDAMRSLLLSRQDAARLDSPSDFSRVIDGLRLEYARIVDRGTLETVAEGAAASVLRNNRLQVGRQFKAILGIDLLAGDPPLEMLMQTFTIENVSLIKTISSKYFDEIEQSVFRNWRAGIRAEEMISGIMDRYKVSKSSAMRIARDQTGKLNGQLVEARHKDLGISQYTWRGINDERTRSLHSERIERGAVYSWDDPPEGGHPGEPIQCRCWGEPYIPGVNA